MENAAEISRPDFNNRDARRNNPNAADTRVSSSPSMLRSWMNKFKRSVPSSVSDKVSSAGSWIKAHPYQTAGGVILGATALRSPMVRSALKTIFTFKALKKIV